MNTISAGWNNDDSYSQPPYIPRFLDKYKLRNLRDSFQAIIDSNADTIRWRVLYRIFAEQHNWWKKHWLIPDTTVGENGIFAQYRIRPMNAEGLSRIFWGVVFKILIQPQPKIDPELQRLYGIFRKKYMKISWPSKEYIPLLDELRMKPEGNRPRLILKRYKDRIRNAYGRNIPKGLYKNIESIVSASLPKDVE